MKALIPLFFMLVHVGIVAAVVVPPPAAAQNPRDCISDCSTALSDCLWTAESDLETCARSCGRWRPIRCLERCHDQHLADIEACLNTFSTCISRCEI